MFLSAISICLVSSAVGLLLSKSSVQICENRGLHGHGDPQNLVAGKSCEKKLIVVMTVKNNQKGTEKLYATVSRVRDETSNEYARLYNPFMITLSKSPVLINYPYFYTGFSVNNLPYEEIKMMKGNWWSSDSSKQCYDQWQAEEKDELRPICGYQYTTKKVVQPDGSYKEVKNRIWDSQGFCCKCSSDEKNANTFEEAKNYKRSGLNCKFFTKASQASGHCMKMDKLWYTVHSFTESYRDFTIHIRAFDQIEKVVNDKTVVDFVNGGEIILSPSQKSGVGKYQRIIAHYVGDFAPVKSYPVLTERYLLIPRAARDIDAEQHPQMKDGPSKYLILPMSYVDLRGGACNKVGVSYSSFKNQAHSGEGFGCQQQKGYCLMNQPHHFFQEDLDRLNKDETPQWFPSRYGKLVGVRKPVGKEADDNFLLSFESEEDHVSLVTLQISADDVILIVNRATGEIVRAAVRDFEALSLNGKLHVEVRNTGYVTADFYVSIPVCSEGIHEVQEKGASVDPQMTKSFTFSLKTHKSEGTLYSCIVQLFDSKRALLAQRNISFSTTTPCVCEEMACKCECSDDGGVKCVKDKGKAIVRPGVFKVKKKSSGFFDTFKNIFNGVDNMFAGLFGNFWPYVKIIVLGVVGLIAFSLFINCGGIKLVMYLIKGKAFKSARKGFSERKGKFKKRSSGKGEHSEEDLYDVITEQSNTPTTKTKQGKGKQKQKGVPSKNINKKVSSTKRQKSVDPPSSLSNRNQQENSTNLPSNSTVPNELSKSSKLKDMSSAKSGKRSPSPKRPPPPTQPDKSSVQGKSKNSAAPRKLSRSPTPSEPGKSSVHDKLNESTAPRKPSRPPTPTKPDKNLTNDSTVSSTSNRPKPPPRKPSRSPSPNRDKMQSPSKSPPPKRPNPPAIVSSQPNTNPEKKQVAGHKNVKGGAPPLRPPSPRPAKTDPPKKT